MPHTLFNVLTAPCKHAFTPGGQRLKNKLRLPHALDDAFTGPRDSDAQEPAGVGPVLAAVRRAAGGAKAVDWDAVAEGDNELAKGRWQRISAADHKGKAIAIYGPGPNPCLLVYSLPLNALEFLCPLLNRLFCTLIPAGLLHSQDPPINCFACAECKKKHGSSLASSVPFDKVTSDELAG